MTFQEQEQPAGNAPVRTDSILAIALVHYQARPLVFLLPAFIAGILSSHFGWIDSRHGGLPLLTGIILSTIIALSLPSSLFPWKTFKALAALGLFALLGLSAAQFQIPPKACPLLLRSFLNRPDVLYVGEVSTPPDFRWDGKVRIPIRLKAAMVDGRPSPLEGGVMVTVPAPDSTDNLIVHGDTILTRLTLKELHNFNNPGGYDYVAAQAALGIYARAVLPDQRLMVKITPTDRTWLHHLAGRMKQGVNRIRIGYLRFIETHAPGDAGALYAALLLGYRNLIPTTLQDAINASGTAHLISISGLHLSLVGMSVFGLSRRLVRCCLPMLLSWTTDKHVSAWIAFGATAYYAAVSGLTLPTWRALAAFTFIFLGILRFRRDDFFTTLAAAAMLILVIAPSSLCEPSFQLCFAALAGIVMAGRSFSNLSIRSPLLEVLSESRYFPFLKPFWGAFWMSLAATIATLPIVAYHFHSISVVGLLTNVLLVPLVGMVSLPLGLAACVMHTVFPPLAVLMLKAGAMSLELTRWIITTSVQPQWACWYVGAVSPAWPALYYSIILVLLSPCSLVKRALVTMTLIVVTGAAVSVHHLMNAENSSGLLRATVIDVGQGSAVLLEFPTGETMLVDGGGFWDDTFDVGKNVVAPFLWNSSLRKIDYVVLSHDHPDHGNGLKFITENFEIGQFWQSGVTSVESHRSSSVDMARSNGIPVKTLGDILGEHALGGCIVSVLHPSQDYVEHRWDGNDLNNVSLVLSIRHGKSLLILPGDIDQSVEQSLPVNTEQAVKTLLVASHHGSARSNGEALYRKLSPSAVLFSCGFDNMFGFPSSEVLNRCASMQIKVFRTDIQGAIRAVSDGRDWVVSTEISVAEEKSQSDRTQR